MRKAYPTALLEFEQWFRTEGACRRYLYGLRWPDGFHCPHCAHTQVWWKASGLLRCGQCRRDTSVTAGTIFHRSHLPLRVWFRAMWHVTSQKTGMSALGLQRVLGLGSYESAWKCLHKLRRAMVRPGRGLLSGTVEVDETAVGGREKGQGFKKKTWVGVAVEARGKGSGRVRLEILPGVHTPTIRRFVQGVVEPGSTIVSDGRAGYKFLSELGYKTSRHPLYHKDKKEVDRVLPRVHRVASLLKRWILGIHHGSVSRQHLAAYLDEFTFRFNRRGSPNRGMLFYRLAQQTVSISPKRNK